jgi:hypothetical protein
LFEILQVYLTQLSFFLHPYKYFFITIFCNTDAELTKRKVPKCPGADLT